MSGVLQLHGLPCSSGHRTSPISGLHSRCRAASLRPHRGCVVAVRAAAETKPFKVPSWDVAFDYLTRQKDFSSTPAEEVHEAVKAGKVVLVDVRPSKAYEAGHPQGAVSVQIYQQTDFSKPSFTRYLKAFALMANGVQPVEPNPDFMVQLKQASGNKAVCLMCETGGSLVPNPSFPTGKTSRSLQATHRAVQSGDYPDVLHLKGGVSGWARAGLPFDGDYDPSAAGRTPGVVE
ncbi:hypothetical protein WJX73_000722 [Symbiochloris irregularis]|uniref:Rhodanese domain-containing protein n=1 Tax=Symbiochloris irregularis TaxID=706552 RepID=A0AAW1NRB1_9CHLO